MMLSKMSENFRRNWFDTKHINLWTFREIIEKRHKVFAIIVQDEKIIKSLHISFMRYFSDWTRLLWDFVFVLIITQNLHEFLSKIDLMRFILVNIFVRRRTFCFFKCFSLAYQMYMIFLLTEDATCLINSTKTKTKTETETRTLSICIVLFMIWIAKIVEIKLINASMNYCSRDFLTIRKKTRCYRVSSLWCHWSRRWIVSNYIAWDICRSTVWNSSNLKNISKRITSCQRNVSSRVVDSAKEFDRVFSHRENRLPQTFNRYERFVRDIRREDELILNAVLKTDEVQSSKTRSRNNDAHCCKSLDAHRDEHLWRFDKNDVIRFRLRFDRSNDDDDDELVFFFACFCRSIDHRARWR